MVLTLLSGEGGSEERNCGAPGVSETESEYVRASVCTALPRVRCGNRVCRLRVSDGPACEHVTECISQSANVCELPRELAWPLCL